MNILARAAEAIILDKGHYIIKKRIKKGYRIKNLDIKLRKERTNLEYKLITRARRIGVNVPSLMNKNTYEIRMEKIGGSAVKNILNKKNLEFIAKEIGRQLACLHKYDIVHGDLTTSNMIFFNNKVYFIDFGLGYFSQRIEDKATDLYLLKQAVMSKHAKFFNTFYNLIIKEYKKNYDNSENVLKRLETIEKRRRYTI